MQQVSAEQDRLREELLLTVFGITNNRSLRCAFAG